LRQRMFVPGGRLAAVLEREPSAVRIALAQVA
jgi:hypothetical protein